MKSKEDKLDVDEWIAVPVDLSKPNDAVKKDVVKKDVYNADIKKILKIKYLILVTSLLMQLMLPLMLK